MAAYTSYLATATKINFIVAGEFHLEKTFAILSPDFKSLVKFFNPMHRRYSDVRLCHIVKTYSIE